MEGVSQGDTVRWRQRYEEGCRDKEPYENGESKMERETKRDQSDHIMLCGSKGPTNSKLLLSIIYSGSSHLHSDRMMIPF